MGNESQTIEELANGLFDEMGFEDGDELTFDKNSYMPNDETQQNLGEQDKNTEKSDEQKPPVKKEEAQAERLYAGKFKTVEEMEAAFLQGNQAQPQQQVQQQAPEEKIPDLDRSLLATLHEQDDADGTNFTVEYLKKKMSERNLSDFEIEKLKELDAGGKDLYGEYVSAKTRREVMAELQPTLKPIQDQQSKEQYDSYVKNEKAIFDALPTEFEKNELATLKQKTSDPKFNEAVMKQSSISHIIEHEFKNGSKATAYKLLLGESKAYLARQTEQVKSDKKAKSFPADIGVKADPSKRKTAATIEDAFNDSLQELNM